MGDGDGDTDGTGGTAGDGDGDGELGGMSGDGDADTGGTSGDGDGDTGGTSGDGDGDGDSVGGSDGTGGMQETSCADALLDSDTTSVNTAAADNTVELSCAAGTSADVILEWVAPVSDYFVFDTAGSDYDTAVALVQDSCDGSELACSAGANGGQFGRAVAQVERDETYYIVVSGNSGDSGNVELSVAPVTCPATDLTGQPLPATFSTVGGADDFEVTCDLENATAQPERTFRYTADEATLYRFSARSETIRPVIDVYKGVICGGQHLGCNGGQMGLTAYPAQVTRFLEAGESVTVVVQGREAAGEFEFDVEKIPASASGGCHNPLELTSEVSGTVLAEDTHEVSNSCTWAGSAVDTYGEHVYRFALDIPSGGGCTVTVNIEGGMTGYSYLLAGENCSGPEVECRSSVTENPTAYVFTAADSGEYVLVVENQAQFGQDVDYTITSSCL